MGRLVYHNLSGLSGQYSPFDGAVLEVARSGSVNIVSPYIGVNYLQRIIQVSNGWRLISDIEAWLSSLSVQARPKAWSFIRENLESIHHCPAIHAKAVISQNLAMLGSANLTSTGILGRTEMGIFLDDLPLVTELCAWFDTLWEQTLPPVADEADAFVKWLDDEAARAPARREKFSLSASSKAIRARLSALPVTEKLEPEKQALNLGSVAKELVIKDQLHYDSLEQAVEAAINTLAKRSFSFGEVISDVRTTFANASVREVYFVLLQHCANHVRSVFAENTINRLIFSDGSFKQSTRELIPPALAPFDTFLSELIKLLDFNQYRELQDEEYIEKLTGMRGGDQVILVAELIDCGLLDIEDVAGELPRYKLLDDFEWVGRYKLFETAIRSWLIKKSSSAKQPVELSHRSEDDENEFADEIVVTPISDEQMKAAFDHLEKLRRTKIDKIITNILAKLFVGHSMHPSKQFIKAVSRETGVGENLVKQVLSANGKDVPKVIIASPGRLISIYPSLDWDELENYPMTQKVCKKFLGTEGEPE